MNRPLIAVTVWLLLASVSPPNAEAQRVKVTETMRLFQSAQQHIADAERFAASGARKESRQLMKQAQKQLIKALNKEPGFVAAAIALADLLLKLDRSKLAVSQLKKTLSHEPENLSVKHLLGIHLFRLNRHAKGAKYLEQVARQRPKLFDVQYLLAGYHYRNRRYKKALPFALTYLKLKPKDVAVRGMVGNIHLAQKQLAKAARSFKGVLELDPSNVTVLVNLGKVYFELKNFKGAIATYEQAIQVRPDLAIVHFNLGSCYYALRKWRKAARSFQEFLVLEPKHAKGHLNAGKALIRAGKPNEALGLLAKATDLAPRDPWAPYEMSGIEKKRGNLTRAASHAAVALSRKPKNATLLARAGTIARLLGDYAGAIKHLIRASKIKPRSAMIKAELGFARIMAGKVDDGIKDLEAAYTLSPRDRRVRAWLPVALTRRGIAQVTVGKPAPAEKDFRRALKINPKLEQAAWNLALVLDSAQKPKQAMAVIAATLDRAPTNPNLYLAKAYLLIKQGKAESAQRALARSKGAQDVGLRWLVQGAIHAHFKEFEAAIAAFEQAADRNANPGALLTLTRLDRAANLLKRRRSAAAIRLLEGLRTGLTKNQKRVRNALLVLAYLKTQRSLRKVPGLMASVSSGPIPQGWGVEAMHRDANLILGYAYYRLGREKQALKTLEAFTAKRKNNEWGRRLLAHVLKDLAERDYVARRYKGAEKKLTRAISLAGETPRLRQNLACILYSRGEYPAAARVFEELYERATVPETILNYGLYLDDVKRDGNQARKLFQKYLNLGGVASSLAKQRLQRKERIFGP